MSDLLERTARDLIAHPADGPTADDLHRRLIGRRHRRVAAMAAVLLVVAGAGLVAVTRRDVGTAGDGGDVLTCDDDGCHGFDRLPVLDGAADYYVCPASLGTPKVDTRAIDSTLRCSELNATFDGCTKVAGMAGLPAVSYDVAAGTTIDTTNRTESSFSVSIGTVFADTTVADYVHQWAFPPDATPVTLADGTTASQLVLEGKPSLVWQARPGVIVWVSVPPEQVDQLPAIADGVRRVPGPSTINRFVVVPGTGPAYDGGHVSPTALIAARGGGQECVGLGFVGGCGTDIAARTFVLQTTAGLSVLGSVPPEVAAVRVSTRFGQSKLAEPFAFADDHSRYYAADLGQDLPELVEWLRADGDVLARFDRVMTAGSINNPGLAGDFGSGQRIVIAQVGGRLVDLGADVVASSERNEVAGTYLCTYVGTTAGLALTCSTPPQLTVVDSSGGFVYGAVDADVASVEVGGRPVELHAVAEMPDRRFFVAAGDAAVLRDAAGNVVDVPAPSYRLPF